MLVVAYISMFIDHIYKFAIVPFELRNNPIFGRLAMPIFAYLLATGMKRTRSKEKYMFRLLIFALISQIPYILMIYDISGLKLANMTVIEQIATTVLFFTQNLNVGFELLFGAIIIYILQNTKLRFMDKFISIALLIYLIEIIAPGTWHRIALILMFYKLELNSAKDVLKMSIVMLVIVCTYIIYQGLLNISKYGFMNIIRVYSIDLYSILALPVIYYYIKLDKNKKARTETDKQSQIKKVLKYSIYPVHLILIALYRIFIIPMF